MDLIQNHPTRSALARAACCCALFISIGAALIGSAGLGHDEGWHATVTLALIDPAANPPLSGYPSMPLMRDTYNGALKSYLLYIPFRLFGVGVATLRWTTLLLGAFALFFLVLLTTRLYGPSLGFVFGLLFAMDPALILAACFDIGPQILMLLLKLAAFWLLAEWWLEPNKAWRLFAAGVLLGLGLWEKTHFLWLVCALPVSMLVIPWRHLRPRLTAVNGLSGSAGFLTGASAFILFNLKYSMLTFTAPGTVGDPMLHLRRLSQAIMERHDLMTDALTGAGQYSTVAGVRPPEFTTHFTYGLGSCLAILLLVYFVKRGGIASLRHVWFWLALSLLIFMGACLTPASVKSQHLYLLYPFPQFVLIALIAHGLKEFRTLALYRPRWTVPIFAACVAAQFAVIWSFRADLQRNGGARDCFSGMPLAARWLEDYALKHPRTQLLADNGLIGMLSIYSQGRLNFKELPPGSSSPADSDKNLSELRELLKCPDNVVLLHIPTDAYREPMSSFEALQFLKIGLQPLLVMDYDGKPWLGAYRVVNASKAGAGRPAK